MTLSNRNIAPVPLPRLWVCGDAMIYGYAPRPIAGEITAPAWTWDSQKAAGLSADERTWFTSMDEVKPVVVDGAACLLATSSGHGGVILIRQADQRILFCAPLPNAHSAELLPGRWIVAAGSYGSDQLTLYPLPANAQLPHPPQPQPAMTIPFPQAHGVLWDARRNRLWAIGKQSLVRYAWTSSTLTEEKRSELPETQAHDLSRDGDADALLITTGRGVWRFDLATEDISPFLALARVADVKSISVDPATGILAFQKGEAGNWWSDTIYFLTPDGRLDLLPIPGVKLYKARWDLPQDWN